VAKYQVFCSEWRSLANRIMGVTCPCAGNGTHTAWGFLASSAEPIFSKFQGLVIGSFSFVPFYSVRWFNISRTLDGHSVKHPNFLWTKTFKFFITPNSYDYTNKHSNFCGPPVRVGTRRSTWRSPKKNLLLWSFTLYHKDLL
jgi:hypothetical protein